MLAFHDLWVHSKRPTTESPSHERLSTSAPTLSSTCHDWLSKITKRSVVDKPLSVNKRVLIRGISGTLLSGQVTVLTGASGSGKSVLLRVLAGLLPLSSGDVRLRAEDDSNSLVPCTKDIGTHNIGARDLSISDTSNHSISIYDSSPTTWRSQVSLLAQHPQLLEGRVLDNLQMPYGLQAHQHRRFDVDWHINQLAHLERSPDFLYQQTTHLSGGEQQLVNTLRLLQLNPQVLLLDEPTAALDSDTSAQLVKLLMCWLRADSRRTLLWVTHDTQDIMPLADHHWHMQAGELKSIF
ncbi:ATP-binding cassette domain-containing protein [Psychrobacter sp. B38]|uniref:ABC transporter ATP-binding protein n=1 Tax=Psychrobacter sp. B38 TaxID=3143538 RepID=UPI00320D4216